MQYSTASATLETPYMPLTFQRYQSLSFFQFFLTPSALIGIISSGTRLRCTGITYWYLYTLLTEHLFTGIGDLFARGERLSAAAAREASLVVGFTQCSDNLAFHVIVAGGALGAKVTLIVSRAIVAAILAEEAALGQRVAANFTLETLRVEVLLLHA